jgi:hypothetical protein
MGRGAGGLAMRGLGVGEEGRLFGGAARGFVWVLGRCLTHCIIRCCNIYPEESDMIEGSGVRALTVARRLLWRAVCADTRRLS